MQYFIIESLKNINTVFYWCGTCHDVIGLDSRRVLIGVDYGSSTTLLYWIPLVSFLGLYYEQ